VSAPDDPRVEVRLRVALKEIAEMPYDLGVGGDPLGSAKYIARAALAAADAAVPDPREENARLERELFEARAMLGALMAHYGDDAVRVLQEAKELWDRERAALASSTGAAWDGLVADVVDAEKSRRGLVERYGRPRATGAEDA
jgi:hypothetical protein